MEEITGPVIAITLVLASVFVPTAFMAGITGQFFKQFALTIATATIISAINAMTMAPARAVTLIKPHTPGHGHREALPPLGWAFVGGLVAWRMLSPTVAHWFGVAPAHGHETHAAEQSMTDVAMLWAVRAGCALAGGVAGYFLSPLVNYLMGYFFVGFNWVFDRLSTIYGELVRGTLRVAAVMVVVYIGLIGLTVLGFKMVPGGFIPQQDKGYLVVNAQLPDGASLERTDAVVKRMTEIAMDSKRIGGVGHVIGLPGYSVLTSNNISNAGGMFVVLEPFEKRAGHKELSADAVAARLRAAYLADIQEARVGVFGAPPVDGLGSTGGFKLQIQDKSGGSLEALEGAVANVRDDGNKAPGLTGLFSTFSANQPQLYVNVDRVKAQKAGVDLDMLYDTLQAYLGSAYVNDITLYNRNWQVNVQAGAKSRMLPADVGKLQVRNSSGGMVPLSTLVTIRPMTGPALVNHYNLYPSAEVNGNTKPGTSSGQAIEEMDKVAKRDLPRSMGYEWTELSYQQIEAGKDLLTKLIFPLAVVFVFMVLAAQYESWSMPMAILLIVPMCLLSAIAGVWAVSLDNNIFVQIGLVVLVGLAAKNAILIVEFAKQREADGLGPVDAVVDACKQRLRPILMTSFAFILGVVPLMLAKGAGSEMRVALGIAVFSGMLGVTVFGLFFTPVFYLVIRWFGGKKESAPPPPPVHHEEPAIAAAHKHEVGDGTAIQTAPAEHHAS
jgi:multidrug efflux pump